MSDGYTRVCPSGPRVAAQLLAPWHKPHPNTKKAQTRSQLTTPTQKNRENLFHLLRALLQILSDQCRYLLTHRQQLCCSKLRDHHFHDFIYKGRKYPLVVVYGTVGMVIAKMIAKMIAIVSGGIVRCRRGAECRSNGNLQKSNAL